jgi:hypothetical protein
MTEIECAILILKQNGDCFGVSCYSGDKCPLRGSCGTLNKNVIADLINYLKEHKAEALEFLI